MVTWIKISIYQRLEKVDQSSLQTHFVPRDLASFEHFTGSKFKPPGYSSDSFSPVETEIWNAENGTFKVIEPTLSYGHYAFGVALYPVDSEFCSK